MENLVLAIFCALFNVAYSAGNYFNNLLYVYYILLIYFFHILVNKRQVETNIIELSAIERGYGWNAVIF